MLEDLSAHVLDISENSTMAGADEVEITIKEDEREDLLLFSVKDNGRGMSPEFVAKVTDHAPCRHGAAIPAAVG